MKILYLHQHFSTPRGSAGTRSWEMARYLVSRGHEVTVVCGDSYRNETGLDGEFRRGVRRGIVEGVHVVEVAVSYSNYQGTLRRALAFLSFAARASLIALREECDVVFATSTPLTIGIPGLAARWLRRKPFVFEVRDLWPELPRATGVVTNPLVLKGMELLEWVTCRSAHRCIGLAPGMVDGIERVGVSRDRIALIPNGCDLELFDPSRVDESGAVQIPGVEEGDFVAAYAGAHGHLYGLSQLQDAAAILKNTPGVERRIRIVFVGDGKLKPGLVERARQEGLSSCIFMDPVPKGQLAGILRRADLGLMVLRNVPAMYYGTSPNKFFDYIAAGLPVLNNYPGWLADMITEVGCGWVIPAENPEALAATLLEASRAPRAEMTRMGNAARHLAESRFSRRELASRLESELLKARNE